jgi:hypothetical protein
MQAELDRKAKLGAEQKAAAKAARKAAKDAAKAAKKPASKRKPKKSPKPETPAKPKDKAPKAPRKSRPKKSAASEWECPGCLITKPITAFGPVGKPRFYCKPCDAARALKRYHQDPEAARAKLRERSPDQLKTWRRNRLERMTDDELREFRAKRAAGCRAYRARNPNKANARTEVKLAIKSGQLPRPTSCAVIGCSDTRELHYHHHDYTRPLDVIPLCRPHHDAVHHRGPLMTKTGRLVTAPEQTTFYREKTQEHPRVGH